MSWAANINTENCFERYAFDQSFAPSSRRTLERSASSSEVPTRRNMAHTPSRAHSASPAPRKRSFFDLSSKFARRSSAPHVNASISAPVLISSTNPLVVVQSQDGIAIPHVAAPSRAASRSSISKTSSQLAVQISEMLEESEDEEEYEEEEEPEEAEEDSRYMTSLSPPPTHSNRSASRQGKEVEFQSDASEIQIQHPQPRSHFSLWTVSPSENNSRASSPTDSTFSYSESDDSCSTSSSPAPESFEYNPYISKVSQRGFQSYDEALVGQLSPASLEDHKQVTALEEYLSDMGFM